MRRVFTFLVAILTPAGALLDWQKQQLEDNAVVRQKEAQVAAMHERAERKAEREAAELAAEKQAAKDAAAAEAAAIAAAEAAAAAVAAKKKADDEARFQARLEASAKAEAAINLYSISRDSHTYHVNQQYFLKPKSNPAFCMTVPSTILSEVSTGYRNGLAVVLSACDVNSTAQLFSYDPTSQYIHPQAHPKFSTSYCLDFEVDSKDFRPLTVFRCDKTFSSSAKPRHQAWTFANGTHLTNVGTKKCAATGTAVHAGPLYDGKAVQQYICNTNSRGQAIQEQAWIWVPLKYYKADAKSRSFVV